MSAVAYNTINHIYQFQNRSIRLIFANTISKSFRHHLSTHPSIHQSLTTTTPQHNTTPHHTTTTIAISVRHVNIYTRDLESRVFVVIDTNGLSDIAAQNFFVEMRSLHCRRLHNRYVDIGDVEVWRGVSSWLSSSLSSPTLHSKMRTRRPVATATP